MTSTKKYNVNLSSNFKNELDNIYFHLLFTYRSPKAAKRFFNNVRKSVLNLSFLPERYARLSNTSQNHYSNIRKLPVGNYVILYSVDNVSYQVSVLHIFHR